MRATICVVLAAILSVGMLAGRQAYLNASKTEIVKGRIARIPDVTIPEGVPWKFKASVIHLQDEVRRLALDIHEVRPAPGVKIVTEAVSWAVWGVLVVVLASLARGRKVSEGRGGMCS